MIAPPPNLVTRESTPALVRAVGRWGLAALMLNTMIGASIFGLPALIAARLGNLSPLGYLVGGAAVALVAACLSEVASQFSDTGGPYLYTRVAFGRFAAIQIGWLTWLSRIAATSAVANLFISYLGTFVPVVVAPIPRAIVLTVLVALLAAVNYMGVASGSRLSNFFTATKVILLLGFIGAGFAALFSHPAVRVSPAAVHPTTADWFDAIILMIYAYGGFEAALFMGGESRDPRRDPPFALFIAIAAAVALYFSVQYVVIHTLPDAASSTTPAVDAARRFLGSTGVFLIGVGALLSAYGYLSANMLHTPRLMFAMGEQGDLPKIFGSVHPRFRSPYFSIMLFAIVVLLFALKGDFRWNATLAAISRLFVYAGIVGALPVLRRRNPKSGSLRLPAGNIIAGLALLVTATLATRLRIGDIVIMFGTFLIGLLNWLWTRRGVSRPIATF